MTDWTPDAEWHKLYDDDGTWRFVKLERMPADGADYHDASSRYPDAYVAEIAFLPAYCGDDWNNERPYYATEMCYSVHDVSDDAVEELMSHMGMGWYLSLEELEAKSLSKLVEQYRDKLTAAQSGYLLDCAKLMAFTGADTMPNGKTVRDLKWRLDALVRWYDADPFFRAECLWIEGPHDTTGYGDGTYETFSDACASAGIGQDDVQDDAQWNERKRDIEPYGPECHECGAHVFPRYAHAMAHLEYLLDKLRDERRAERERERMAEAEMDSRFDGD